MSKETQDQGASVSAVANTGKFNPVPGQSGIPKGTPATPQASAAPVTGGVITPVSSASLISLEP